MAAADRTRPAGGGSAREVFAVFLRLGLSSFGGPAAHIGYFRHAFVIRRAWLSEADLADIVGLCNFLPGPASSQTGFLIGLARAGWGGALAAWAGFTLPSALMMTGFALTARRIGYPGLLHGLMLAAVAIVAGAVWGMARALCPDLRRRILACLAAALALALPAGAAQPGVILFGGLAGLGVCRNAAFAAPASAAASAISRRSSFICLAVFTSLLVLLPLFAQLHPALMVFDAFYRSGALVFGGGHVVLPLLRDAIVAPGLAGDDVFMSGYGAVQAMPGPLFTFAAYLGAVLRGPVTGVAGAALALGAIFLPGLLLAACVQPYWQWLRAREAARAAVQGVNAAVVGLLAAALYDPVWKSAVHSPVDAVVVLALFALLQAGRLPPVLTVAAGAMAGLVL